MKTWIYQFLNHLAHKSFFSIVHETLLTLFPFALIGSGAQMVLKTMFSDDGFFANILYFSNWMPDWLYRGCQAALFAVNQVTIGLFGVLVVYETAKYTARYYHRDAQMAGMTGIITLLLIAFRYDRFSMAKAVSNFNWGLLSGHSILLAFGIGYGVGQLYRWLASPRNYQQSHRLISPNERAFLAIRPLIVAVTMAVIISFVLNFGFLNTWLRSGYDSIVNVGENDNQLWLVILTKLLMAVVDWLGLGTANTADIMMSGASFEENLNYALQHGSAWNVPHPLLGGSLYNSFANFGGHGALLALLVAILIAGHRRDYHRVARWTLIPTLFNSSFAAMVGIPVLMNPLLFVPAIFMPTLNMLIAALAITIHVIPATPYPVLVGTPGPLISFIATNGNWWVLIFTIALFILDVWLYLPFVRILDKWSGQDLEEVDQHAEDWWS